MSLKRHLAVLCLALTLIHSGAATAQILDRVQHSAGDVAQHDHGFFSAIMLDDDHHDHHEDHDHHPDATDHDRAVDDLPDGAQHHHHGDIAPGLIVRDLAGEAAVMPDRTPREFRSDPHVPGYRQAGPERPPRYLALNR
ncbi:hypothetical protein GRI97_15040 [Altererythrobacter xixiisoli]|uniref:Uncharacterized protein n=1 Tax=Croceibacterium xixiisoli TaxID=1476466 RepID=A0A6I4TW77_9SPHN|nr:hypothetical protein [Croceibacterium xixiisoli]